MTDNDADDGGFPDAFGTVADARSDEGSGMAGEWANDGWSDNDDPQEAARGKSGRRMAGILLCLSFGAAALYSLDSFPKLGSDEKAYAAGKATQLAGEIKAIFGPNGFAHVADAYSVPIPPEATARMNAISDWLPRAIEENRAGLPVEPGPRGVNAKMSAKIDLQATSFRDCGYGPLVTTSMVASKPGKTGPMSVDADVARSGCATRMSVSLEFVATGHPLYWLDPGSKGFDTTIDVVSYHASPRR